MSYAKKKKNKIGLISLKIFCVEIKIQSTNLYCQRLAQLSKISFKSIWSMHYFVVEMKFQQIEDKNLNRIIKVF